MSRRRRIPERGDMQLRQLPICSACHSTTSIPERQHSESAAFLNPTQPLGSTALKLWTGGGYAVTRGCSRS
jgi:hypothetical protein